MLSCLWDDAYKEEEEEEELFYLTTHSTHFIYGYMASVHIKEPLLLIGKSSPCADFLFHYLSGHITVNKAFSSFLLL